jgi:hypothetical protein
MDNFYFCWTIINRFIYFAASGYYYLVMAR